ncbi:hypothetical protein AB0K34_36090 [Actinomadura sp. NPDC049382]|uniref:hypothetical protein n=1 Tax=Actinomadura sp. NPDC049382 TaxID=3158220 RepID=UPI0034178D10
MALRAAGCTRIFSKKISARVKVRSELEAALALCRDIKTAAPGQTVIFILRCRTGSARPTTWAHSTPSPLDPEARPRSAAARRCGQEFGDWPTEVPSAAAVRILWTTPTVTLTPAAMVRMASPTPAPIEDRRTT